MYYHYQTVPDQHGAQWKAVGAAEAAHIRTQTAYHMTVLSVAVLDSEDWSNELYQGDLWFDLDMKDKEGRGDLPASIQSVHSLIAALVRLDVDPRLCSYYASGSKGFHVKVPARLMDADKPCKDLPRIYRMLAHRIADLENVQGIDNGVYNGKRGGMLRVENKVRPDGKYKVPLSYEEVMAITPELYAEYVKEGRVVVTNLITKGTMAAGLAREFAICRDVAHSRNAYRKHSPVPDALLQVFTQEHPRCMMWLAANLNVKANKHWNDIAIQAAAFLAHAPLSDHAREALVSDLATNHKSTRCPTPREREERLDYLINYAEEDDSKLSFSCAAMKSVLSANPCSGCQLRRAMVEQTADYSAVEETDQGYMLGDRLLTDFTLQPVRVVFDSAQPEQAMPHLTKLGVYREGKRMGEVVLKSSVWANLQLFRDELLNQGWAVFQGNQTELLALFQHIRTRIEKAGEAVRAAETKKIGIQLIKDPQSGEDLWTYVEPGWCWNATKVTDSVQWLGRPNAANVRGARIKGVAPLGPEDRDVIQTLLEYAQTNRPADVATYLGWAIACILKPKLAAARRVHEFPLLWFYGQSENGKSATASWCSILGGADNSQGGLLAATDITGQPARELGTAFTSIPVILDEANLNSRFFRSSRAPLITNLLKNTYYAQGTATGIIATRQSAFDTTASSVTDQCTTPLIVNSTEPPQEPELRTRALLVHVPREVREVYGPAFHVFTSNMAATEHLRKIYATCVRQALDLDLVELHTMYQNIRQVLPDYIIANQGRLIVNHSIPLLGLRFLKLVLLNHGWEGPATDLMDTLEHHAIQTWNDERVEHIQQRELNSSVTQVLETMARMAALEPGNTHRLLPGTHYYRGDKKIYIRLNLALDLHNQYAARNNRIVIFTDERAMVKSVKDQKYTIGYAPLKGLPLDQQWWKISIAALPSMDLSGFQFVTPEVET